MQSRSASSVDMGPCLPVREVLEEVSSLKAVVLLYVVTGEEENEEEEEINLLVAAALSKIDAGVTLLVREVSVALLCFHSGRQDMCICFSLRAWFSRFRNRGRVPSRNKMRRVSIVTTADSAVCIFD